jgi:hypothetical protein
MSKSKWRRPSPQPIPIGHSRTLQLRPLAFLKLMFFCHSASTEVGAFGISAVDEPLTIEDITLIKQRTSVVTVDFDDQAVADHFDAMAESGIPPARCGRIWIHTHPGDSPSPSAQDEHTFATSFAGCDWSVMAILARGGDSYARMQFPAGPGGQVMLELRPAWKQLPQFFTEYRDELPRLVTEWREELIRCVQPDKPIIQDRQPTDLDFCSAMTANPLQEDEDELQWAYWQAWEEGAYV